MANSTQPLADIKTVLASYNTTSGVGAGIPAVTAANANAAGGPIMDIDGNLGLIRLKLEEAYNLCIKVASVQDAGTDSANKALVTGVATLIAQGVTWVID